MIAKMSSRANQLHLPDPTPHGTHLAMTMTLPDAATRDAMLASGMAAGMETSYARLERLLQAGV